MLVKILMCPCHKQEFLSIEGSTFFSQTLHFKCKCKQNKEYFVNFCRLHPYGSNVASIFDHTGTQQKKCFCYKELANLVSQNCCTVRYLLNFKVNKFCFGDSEFVRNFIKDNWCISLNQYLIEYPAEPFWHYKDRRIVVSLDNPRYPVPKKKWF